MQTEEEKIRYDRQVRLWGVSTQQAIASTAFVAVVPPEVHLATSSKISTLKSTSTTPTGFIGEVSKNLVLAGIHRIDLRPFTPTTTTSPLLVIDNTVRIEDFESNFYIRTDGSDDNDNNKRHVAMLPFFQDLNPFVCVVGYPNGKEGDKATRTKPNSVTCDRVILLEQCNLLEIIMAADGTLDGDVNNNNNNNTINNDNCTSGITSVWITVAVGRWGIALEHTTRASINAEDDGANTHEYDAARQQARQRLLALLDAKKTHCATLTPPARIIVLIMSLLKIVVSSNVTHLGDGSELLCLAHDVVLDQWGLALTEEVCTLVQTACTHAAELLVRGGYSFDNNYNGGRSVNPCSTVVDCSVMGGVVAQRMIAAISTPLETFEDLNYDGEKIYSFIASGSTVEAFVGKVEKIK